MIDAIKKAPMPAILFGLLTLAILLTFLWGAVPLAVQCWDWHHRHAVSIPPVSGF